MTTHGTPLSPGPGSSTVFIGGKPVWRAGGDFHTCPLATGVVPHVGGVVAAGSPTVLVNGMPLARQGDMIMESGPPNAISVGAATVFVG